MPQEFYDVILEQLGGNKFTTMTGAKNLQFDSKERAFTFRVPKCKQGINYVKIVLTLDDDYKMEFGKIYKDDYSIQELFKGVHAESLKSMFEEATGLRTSL